MNPIVLIAALFAASAVEKSADKGNEIVSFYTLPTCQRVEAEAEVLRPGAKEWTILEEGRFYPLGSSFRAGKSGSAVIAFGKDSTVKIEKGSSFTTRAQALGVKTRTIVPLNGTVDVSLPASIKPGLFFVSTSSLTVQNAAGESKYVFSDKGDGIDLTVRCVTGTLDVKGRHFAIPSMRAADEFRLRASHDDLETVIYGKSGDYVIRLERGLVPTPKPQDDGTIKDVIKPESLDWHLSVGTRVQINRGVSAIGDRMGVAVMTFDPAGTMKNHFAFTEGRHENNTGELVPQQSDDDVAKHADETTDSEATDIEEESTDSESPSEGSDESSSEADDASDSDEDTSSSDDDVSDDDF